MKNRYLLMVRYFLASSLTVFSLLVQGDTEPQADPLNEQLDKQQKGLAIFEEIDRRDSGFGDFSSQQEMVLRNKSGQESRRIMDNTVLEGNADSETDGDKTLIVFREPKRIRGTALITHAHSQRDDDQWLYLPALERVKRISGASKAGSFVGSEFSYEDLAPQEVEDYSYEYIEDEIYAGLDCFKVIRVPTDIDSGYTRQVVWVDKAEYRIQKIAFYDRKDTLIKILTVEGYQLYLNKYWRPGRLAMVNQQDGKSTDMIATDYVFRKGLTDADFSENSLRRVH